jgi:hypothetical protein
MRSYIWYVVRHGYIVGEFKSIEEAETFMSRKGWREYRDDASIVCHQRC